MVELQPRRQLERAVLVWLEVQHSDHGRGVERAIDVGKRAAFARFVAERRGHQGRIDAQQDEVDLSLIEDIRGLDDLVGFGTMDEPLGRQRICLVAAAGGRGLPRVPPRDVDDGPSWLIQEPTPGSRRRTPRRSEGARARA